MKTLIWKRGGDCKVDKLSLNNLDLEYFASEEFGISVSCLQIFLSKHVYQALGEDPVIFQMSFIIFIYHQ